MHWTYPGSTTVWSHRYFLAMALLARCQPFPLYANGDQKNSTNAIEADSFVQCHRGHRFYGGDERKTVTCSVNQEWQSHEGCRGRPRIPPYAHRVFISNTHVIATKFSIVLFIRGSPFHFEEMVGLRLKEIHLGLVHGKETPHCHKCSM